MTTRPGSQLPDEGPGPPGRSADLPPPAERGPPSSRTGWSPVSPPGPHARPSPGAPPYRPTGAGLAAPSASAAVRTGSVRLHLAMDLPYPTDIPHVCERIQHDVAKQVTRLTGLEVGEVTLTVRRLVTAADASRGRVR